MPATAKNIRRAFTLIELLVVMSILVILLTIALPVFNYITAARSTESGVNMVAAMVSRARNLALNRPDDKLIGVLFYTRAEDDRDAMQLVEVEPEEKNVALERYAGWQQTGTYYGPDVNPLAPINPDVALYATRDTGLLNVAPTLLANRPIVKRYIAKTSPTVPTGSSPPVSGPVFSNGNWDESQTGNTTPVLLDSEVQYLPRGVRVRVIKREPPNYEVNGIVLFDKQGRLATRRWGIISDNDKSVDGGEILLEAIGTRLDPLSNIRDPPPITASRVSGLGVAVFNDSDVPEPRTTAAMDTVAADSAEQFTVGSQSGELTATQ